MSYMLVLTYNGYQRQRYMFYRHGCAMTFFSQVYQKVHLRGTLLFKPEKFTNLKIMIKIMNES